MPWFEVYAIVTRQKHISLYLDVCGYCVIIVFWFFSLHFLALKYLRLLRQINSMRCVCYINLPQNDRKTILSFWISLKMMKYEDDNDTWWILWMSKKKLYWKWNSPWWNNGQKLFPIESKFLSMRPCLFYVLPKRRYSYTHTHQLHVLVILE